MLRNGMRPAVAHVTATPVSQVPKFNGFTSVSYVELQVKFPRLALNQAPPCTSPRREARSRVLMDVVIAVGGIMCGPPLLVLVPEEELPPPPQLAEALGDPTSQARHSAPSPLG